MVVKKNLRKFDGFGFERDSDEFQEKLDAAGRLDIGRLKALCDGLGLAKKGTKEELAKRLCEYLLAPEDDEEEEEEQAEDDEEDDEEEEKSEEEAASSEEETAAAKRNKQAKGAAAKGRTSAGAARGGRSAKEQQTVSRSSAGRPRRSTAGRTRGTCVFTLSSLVVFVHAIRCCHVNPSHPHSHSPHPLAIPNTTRSEFIPYQVGRRTATSLPQLLPFDLDTMA